MTLISAGCHVLIVGTSISVCGPPHAIYTGSESAGPPTLHWSSIVCIVCLTSPLQDTPADTNNAENVFQ